MTANFRPGDRFEDVDAGWQRLAIANPKASAQTMLATMLPASVAAAILRQLTLDGTTTLAHLSRDDRRRLSRALVEFPLAVTGSRGYTYAEATAGGVALTEIDAGTMASRRCPGLSCVGEILDVDGRIGGFNFQWAWSSGFTAGRALAARHPCTGLCSSGDSSRPTRSSKAASARSSARSWRWCGTPAPSTCARRAND
jgi:hypothetical protein